MFKRTWDERPEKVGPQVEFDHHTGRWNPVQQVFTAADKAFLASINWGSDKVVINGSFRCNTRS